VANKEKNMNLKSLISSVVITLTATISFADRIELPVNSCVDYISIENESELDCSTYWSASAGTGSAGCPISYSIRINGVAQLEELSGGGYAYDGRHTGLLGVVTAGISEVIWQGLIKPSILSDNALAKAKSNLRFLKAHKCR
jgi:hypothetical protein